MNPAKLMPAGLVHQVLSDFAGTSFFRFATVGPRPVVPTFHADRHGCLGGMAGPSVTGRTDRTPGCGRNSRPASYASFRLSEIRFDYPNSLWLSEFIFTSQVIGEEKT